MPFGKKMKLTFKILKYAQNKTSYNNPLLSPIYHVLVLMDQIKQFHTDIETLKLENLVNLGYCT